MSADRGPPKVDGQAIGARPPSKEEREKMTGLIARYDEASARQDVDAVMSSFAQDAVCELKPAGLRIFALGEIAEMYRRTLPPLSSSFRKRRKLREWWNQQGLVREWAYPVTLASGQEVLTKQLEIFQFDSELERIGEYRVRMNYAYSKKFIAALGDDFSSMAHVQHVSP
jgi:hypothetical protein